MEKAVDKLTKLGFAPSGECYSCEDVRRWLLKKALKRFPKCMVTISTQESLLVMEGKEVWFTVVKLVATDNIIAKRDTASIKERFNVVRESKKQSDALAQVAEILFRKRG